VRRDGERNRSLKDIVKQRYSSWDTGMGKQIEAGQARFENLEEYIAEKGQITPNSSGLRVMLENIFRGCNNMASGRRKPAGEAPTGRRQPAARPES
jgi:hypothetical protein